MPLCGSQRKSAREFGLEDPSARPSIEVGRLRWDDGAWPTLFPLQIQEDLEEPGEQGRRHGHEDHRQLTDDLYVERPGAHGRRLAEFHLEQPDARHILEMSVEPCEGLPGPWILLPAREKPGDAGPDG